MSEPTEERDAPLEGLVERLDQLVPRGGAHLTLDVGPHGPVLVGNRLGYLRLGIEFLGAALRPGLDPDSPGIEPDLGYLLTPDSTASFGACELDESIVSRPPVQARLGAFGQLAAGVLLVGAVLALLVAIAVVWRWVFG